MKERNTPVSQRESYTPSRFTEFLWWLSTAEKSILAESVIDRNRYSIIGMTVLGTWLFASIAWTCFFSTAINSVSLAVILGLFMGFIILCIDRALIKGITRFNRRKAAPLLIRGVLALTIGTFMAQPAILFLFDKEIKLQVSIDNVKRKQLKRGQLELLYKDRETGLQEQKQELTKTLSEKYDAVAKARNNFLAESDGSGGTGKVGLREIAMAKREEYRKLDGEYQALLNEYKPKMERMDSATREMEKNMKQEETEFASTLNEGFLTRVEALSNILKKNQALQFRYYLVVFILILIELMPVIAKTMLPSGSYDEKVMLREKMEIAIANSNIRKEQELKELYNSMAFENDSDAIRSFFSLSKDARNEKIRAFSNKWKDDEEQGFDGLWEKMKKEILSKQEN